MAFGFFVKAERRGEKMRNLTQVNLTCGSTPTLRAGQPRR